MASSKSTVVLIVILCVLGSIALFGAFFMSTGTQEEAAPATSVAESVKPETAETVVAERVPVAKSEPVSLRVAEVLQYQPEGAAIAVGIPPMQKPFDYAMAIAKRLAKEPGVIDAKYADSVAGFAHDLGVDDAKSFSEIAEKLGINSSASVGVFAGPDIATLALPPVPEGGEALPPPPLPSWSVYVQTNDAALFEWVLKELLKDVPGFADATMETVAEGETQIHTWKLKPGGRLSEFAYFVSGTHAGFGTSIELVKGIVSRIAQPIAVVYGTAEMPADAADEIVPNADVAPLFKCFEASMEARIAVDAQQQQEQAQQLEMLRGMLPLYADAGPLVLGLVLEAERVSLAVKMRMPPDSALRKEAGEPSLLRLAPLLSDDTVAFLAYRLSDEAKASFKTRWASSIPPEMRSDPSFAQVNATTDTVVSLLGDELTLGVGPMGPAGPPITAIVSVTNPVKTLEFIQSFGLPLAPLETHGETTLYQIPVPIPVTIGFGLHKDLLIVSNDVAGLKGYLDRYDSGVPGTFLEQIEPAFPVVPRYATLLIRDKLLEVPLIWQAAAGASGQSGALNDIGRVGSVVRELRFDSVMEDNTGVTRLTAYVNP